MLKNINWLDDFGIFLIRAMVGAVFIYHGSQKLFPFFDGAGLAGTAQYLNTLSIPYPAYGAVLVGAAEFIGGLALITGYGMRMMALPMVFAMGVASWYGHSHTFSILKGGMEYPLTLGVVLFGLACTGPGKFSLRRLWPERAAYQVETNEETRRRVLRRSETQVQTRTEPQVQTQPRRTPAMSRPSSESVNTARAA